MPVKRYKSFLEAKEDLFVYKPDKAYYKRMHELIRLIEKAAPHVKFPPGVYKYRTFEEAEEHLKKLYKEQGLLRF
jgi:hypothetical protein